MSAGSKLGRPKGRKNSRPAPKPAPRHKLAAKAAIKEVIARADELHMPIAEVIERAFRNGPHPIDPSVLLQQYMPENPRVFLWAMDHIYPKPKQQGETTGAAGGPMEIKVVIETIGGDE